MPYANMLYLPNIYRAQSIAVHGDIKVPRDGSSVFQRVRSSGEEGENRVGEKVLHRCKDSASGSFRRRLLKMAEWKADAQGPPSFARSQCKKETLVS